MATDSQDMEYEVENPFGTVNIKEIPFETKPEHNDLLTSLRLIDVNTEKNELVKDNPLLHLKIKIWKRLMLKGQNKNPI